MTPNRWFAPSFLVSSLLVLALSFAVVMCTAGCRTREAEAGGTDPQLHAAELATCASEAECEQGCKRRDLRDCLRLATILELGVGATRDRARARATLERACERDEARACLRLADYASSPAQRAWFRQLAHELAEDGCDRGQARACGFRAVLATSIGDPRRRHWQVRACDRGHVESCRAATDDMRKDSSFEDWELYEYLSDRHDQLRQARCDAHRATDCLVLARDQRDPDLLARSASLFAQECRRGYGPSCERADLLYRELGRERDARDQRRRACQLGVKSACR